MARGTLSVDAGRVILSHLPDPHVRNGIKVQISAVIAGVSPAPALPNLLGMKTTWVTCAYVEIRFLCQADMSLYGSVEWQYAGTEKSWTILWCSQ